MARRRVGPDPLPIPIVVPAPVRGLDRSMPVALQPPLTTNDALNVVTFPSISDRGGVGKRDGTGKAFALQLTNAVGGNRVLGLMEFRARQDDLTGSGGPPADWADLPPGLGAAGNWLNLYPLTTDLLVAGQFTTGGGVTSQRFAKWDILGTGWTDPTPAFSTSVDNPSRAILWDADGAGPKLYAAGGLGAGPINRVARWNGTAWTDLITSAVGVTTIHGIAVYGGKLYVCGNFTAMNGTACARIAYWDPATAIGTWVQPGSGLDGTAYCLEVYNGELYVGGDFANAGGGAAARLAKWNGAAWSSVGGISSVNGSPSIYAMRAVDLGTGSKLYIGGNFVDIGAIAGHITGSHTTDHGLITCWNGTDFIPMQNGLRTSNPIASGYGVLSIEAFNDGISRGVWVAGQFTMASTADGIGLSTPNIAKWDGTSWSAPSKGLAGGSSQNVRHMIGGGVSNNQKLYATGSFTTKNNVGASAMAQWDGTAWAAFDGGGVVTPSATFASSLRPCTLVADAAEKLYVALYASMPSYLPNYYGCGPATPSATVVSARYSLAAWDADGWHELAGYSVGQPSGASNGQLTYGMVDADLGTGNRLYVTGNFTTGPATRIAVYDGTSFSAMGTGLNGAGYCLATNGTSRVYCGGTFTSAGGVANTGRLAFWNGTWTSLNGATAGADADVWSLFYWSADTNLYIGGDFANLGAVAAVRVGYYDGAAFHAMGSGCNGIVYAITSLGADLYVAGAFTTANGVSCSRIAKWTGSTFTPLGAGLDDTARCLFVHDDGSGSKLYVGGQFTTAGGIPAKGIARWTGSAWEAVDTTTVAGFAAIINTMCVTGLSAWDGKLIAAGLFHSVGGETATNVARGDPA